MRVLFIARHYAYVRLFESAVEQLAERGHQVTLAADREEGLGGRGMVERIAARYPSVRLADAPGRHGAWSELARRIRLGLDCLRFFDPRYRATPHLRRRAEERAPRMIVRLARSRLLGALGGPAALFRVLRWLERGLPRVRAIEAFMRSEAPDLVIVTPLIDMGSPQLDHLAAARALGLRTALPVGSWDHLSSKAVLRDVPGRVLVWNESQRREAIEFHRVPADRLVVTGAQCYDQWFDRGPSRRREDFCARVGLAPGRPFVLYVCSSLFRDTADEPAFVEQWVRAVRASDDPRLKDIGILVRPHPARLNEWSGVDLTAYRHVAVWGAHPVDQQAKDDYFDSFYYSAAVVGLNTSAFLEAAVVGKPVHTILVPEISAANQEGTLHFQYLREVGGGLLREARGLEEHVSLLAASLSRDGGGDPKAAAFVDGFVRPFGRGVPATPRFVEALEAAATLPVRRVRRGLAAAAAYALLLPVTAGLALHLRLRPWRTRTKHKWRKARDKQRVAWLRRLKQFAMVRLGEAKYETGPAGPTLAPKADRRRDPGRTLVGARLPESREVRELVTVLARSGRPIVVGPWLSETGFELLYWIPFLAWAKAYADLDPERLVVVSRGGVAEWYSRITPCYEDIFSFFTPSEFRAANDRRIQEQGGRLKHVQVTGLDREILARVRQRRGLGDAELLHPSVMYGLFDHFWFQRAPMTLVEAFTAFSTIPQLPMPERLAGQLPDRYVAAKFYGNVALPGTPGNQQFAVDYVTELARTIDVVLLNTGHQFDDHADFPASVRGRIHTVDHLMTPQDNLAVQTAIIRGAAAFVGTYGGFSYLAPLCGVHTLAFYSHPGAFRFDHLEVAKRAFASLQCGTFVEVDLRAVDLLRLGFGGALRSLVDVR